MVECGGLENRLACIRSRGFESLLLRQLIAKAPSGAFFHVDRSTMPVTDVMTVTAHASSAMVAIPFWLEMLAVVAASISGVLVAREHKLDLVGAVALAVVCGLSLIHI